MTVRLSPVLAGLGTYPFVRLEQARARLRAAGVEIIDFGMGEPREETPGVHPRGAGGRDHAAGAVPERRRAARAARRRSPAGRRAASAPRSTRTPRSSRRSAPRRPSSRSPTSSTARSWRCRRPPTRSTSAARRSPASACSSCRCARSDGWLPDLDARRLGGVGVLWLNYPNNPTGAPRAARVLRARRRAGARARVRARLRRGLLGALLRAASRRLSALQVARPLARRGLQHALQALVDARLPLRVRRRRPRDRRGAEEVPAERRRRAAGVRPARGRRGLGRRGATSSEVRERYRAKRDALLPALEARRACATRAATRRSSCGWTPARTPTRWPRAGSRRASSSRPGSFFGAPGYLRLALVPPPEACARAAEIIRGLA